MNSDNFVETFLSSTFFKAHVNKDVESKWNQFESAFEAIEEWQKALEPSEVANLLQTTLSEKDLPANEDFSKTLFIILCMASNFNVSDKSVAFMPQLCELIANLEVDQRVTLHNNVINSVEKHKASAKEAIFQKLVACFQSFIMLAIAEKEGDLSFSDSTVVNAVLCLELLHEINEAYKFVPFQSFYNPSIEASLNLKEDYPRWKSSQGVSFVGEEGVDEGGIQKEFFQLIIKNIFDHCHGKLFGLAIYNGVTLDVSFPLALYKKILRLPISFEDLSEIDPLLAKGFQELRDFDGNVEETFCWTYEISYETTFGTKTFDLKPNGSSITVTKENRNDFINHYLDFFFNQSVSAPFAAFMEGFDSVVERGALLLFRPEELQELVIGSENLDFKDLEQGTQYDGGFTAETQIIKDFWEVVHSLNNEDRRRLLFFVTGSDRVPVGGLSKLQFVISRNGPDSDRLPTSHTCYNVLLLNEYSSKERLEDRLRKALENSNCGFFLI
ncbi:hypothetical protein HDU97_008630 [Phlyctochytrium planicorne]|nr:hypothetical protein HDU97_008630 [Phlyctochytrium planicorne]